MRWKPLNQRKMPRAVERILAVPMLIILAPLMAVIWFDAQLQKRFGPKAEWAPWFAWRPVRSDCGFGKTVWLETVQRRAWYGQTHYRTLEEATTKSTGAAAIRQKGESNG